MADSRNAKWLRSLCVDSAKNLYNLMLMNTEYHKAVLVEGVELPVDFDNYVALDASVSPLQKGSDWRKFVTCISFDPDLSKGLEWVGGYARFQLNWKPNKDGVWQTPTKRHRGQQPILKRVSEVLTDDEWQAFRAQFLPSEDKASSGISVKILCHHIAYNVLAKTQPSIYPDLPDDVGVGSSVSHLCDNKCISAVHMLLASEHADNLARQRCAGITLICRSGVILQVVDCPHFRRSETGTIESPNCVRLRVVELDFDPFDGSKRAAFLIKKVDFEIACIPEVFSQPGMSGGPRPFSQ